MKTKKLIIICFLITLIPALTLAQGDRKIYDEAKKNLFDKKWQQALNGLDKIITDFPDSPFYTLAYFYKGKSFEELGRAKEAWKCYQRFIDLSNNESLKEEATTAVINLDFILYEKGEKRYLEEIKSFLKKRDWLVQTYAAFKLSYAKDKKIAALAVPVLKKIISRESDDIELVDRAKVALMRIDPGYLKGLTGSKNREPSSISIKIFEKGTGGESFSFTIPFALARLALDAIPAKEKNELKKKGYDLDNILKTLIEGKDLIKVETEDSVLRITID
jgi:tetratricopeptide (TPR) repeat protein